MRRIFISFFLSILLLKYASSTDSECDTKTTEQKGDTECSAFKTSDNDHYCTDNDAGAALPCKEEPACNLLEPDGTITEGDGCAQRTLHKAGNICKTIKDKNDKDICHEYSPCMTTEDLEEAGKENCAELEAQDNYLCVEANEENGTNDDKPCIEVKKTCKYLKPDGTITQGDKCAGYPTLNEEGYICKEKDNANECEEIIECGNKTPENGVSYDNCKVLNAGKNKKCINDGTTACKIATECDTVTDGATEPICSQLTPAPKSKCIMVEEQNVKKCTSKPLCGEADYVTGCTNFVTENDKLICIDTGSACVPKPLCGEADYAEGCPNFETGNKDKICVDTGSTCVPKTLCLKASTGCDGLPTSDGKKICKKDEKENKCVEDDPTENGDTNGGEETKPAGGEETKPAGGEETKPAGGEETKPAGGEETKPAGGEETKPAGGEETKPAGGEETKPTGEADTKPTGEADTKPTGEADTKPTGEADTKPTGEAGPTEGTETDLNKDNKGMLLNMNLYTLLIYFLF